MSKWRLKVNCTCNIWPGYVYVLPIHLATSDLYVAKTFYVRDLFHNLTLIAQCEDICCFIEIPHALERREH